MMKLTKVVLHWKNGAVTEHADSNGVGWSDIAGMLGLSSEGIANAQPDTPQAWIFSLLQMGIGMLMKRFGI